MNNYIMNNYKFVKPYSNIDDEMGQNKIFYVTCIEEIRNIINQYKKLMKNTDDLKNLKIDFTINKAKNIQALVTFLKESDWYCKIYNNEHNVCLLELDSDEIISISKTYLNSPDAFVDMTARFKFGFNDAFYNAIEELEKDKKNDRMVSLLKKKLYSKISEKDKEDDYELENS